MRGGGAAHPQGQDLHVRRGGDCAAHERRARRSPERSGRRHARKRDPRARAACVRAEQQQLPPRQDEQLLVLCRLGRHRQQVARRGRRKPAARGVKHRRAGRRGARARGERELERLALCKACRQRMLYATRVVRDAACPISTG